MRLIEFLIEGYKEALADFSASSNPTLAQELIDKYKILVNRNQVQGDERNIDYWRKKGFAQFQSFVTAKAAQPTKTQLKKKKVVGNSINLIENDEWLIVIPLDKESSCFHGKKSNWCTTKINDNYFASYFENSKILLIYCLQKQTGNMWAIAAHRNLDKIELFDKKDKRLSEEKFKLQTGLDPIRLKNKAFAEHGDTIKNAMDKKYLQLLNYLKIIPTLSNRNEEIENYIINASNKKNDLIQNLVLTYFRQLGKRDYPEEFTIVASKIIGNKASVLLKFIQNIGKDLLLQMFELDPLTIKMFKNPSDKTKKIAVEKNPVAIKYINDPSEQLITYAVERIPGLFLFFSDNENLQKKLVNKDPFIITQNNKNLFTPAVRNLADYLIQKINNKEILDPRRERDYPNYNMVINWPKN